MASPYPPSPSTDEYINNLATQTTIECGDNPGDFVLVTIPDVQKLSVAERDAVYQRAQQIQAADALTKKLSVLTPPPPDEAESNEEGRQLEARARKELEEAGCPPCYPPDVDIADITSQNIPRKFRAIVRYWLDILWCDNVVLRAQATDYREFLAHQLHTRHRFKDKNFAIYMEDVRRRRRKYGLHDNIDLLPDCALHSRLQNWLEFQDYHLRKLERLEAQQEETWQELCNKRKTGPSECLSSYEHESATIARYIKQHMVLLTWIEQQQQVMGLSLSNKHSVRKRPPSSGSALSKHYSSNLRRSKRLSKAREREMKREGRILQFANTTRTRSGRISSKPLRWTPDDW